MKERLSASERKVIYGKFNGRCAYCGSKITFGCMKVDKLNNFPSCRVCSKVKGSGVEDMRKNISSICRKYVGGSYKIVFLFEKELEGECENANNK